MRVAAETSGVQLHKHSVAKTVFCRANISPISLITYVTNMIWLYNFHMRFAVFFIQICSLLCICTLIFNVAHFGLVCTFFKFVNLLGEWLGGHSDPHVKTC